LLFTNVQTTFQEEREHAYDFDPIHMQGFIITWNKLLSWLFEKDSVFELSEFDG
jgi:hypothetical protein